MSAKGSCETFTAQFPNDRYRANIVPSNAEHEESLFVQEQKQPPLWLSRDYSNFDNGAFRNEPRNLDGCPSWIGLPYIFGTYRLEEIEVTSEPDMVRSHFNDMTKV